MSKNSNISPISLGVVPTKATQSTRDAIDEIGDELRRELSKRFKGLPMTQPNLKAMRDSILQTLKANLAAGIAPEVEVLIDPNDPTVVNVKTTLNQGMPGAVQLNPYMLFDDSAEPILSQEDLAEMETARAEPIARAPGYDWDWKNDSKDED